MVEARRPIGPDSGGYEGIRERLVHIAGLLMSGVDLDEVLQNVAKAACEVAGYERCVVVTADADRRSLRGQAGHGVTAETVSQIRMALADVPELARLLPGREPLVLAAEDVAQVVPPEYIELFRITGTLIVIPLSLSSTSELRGLVFVDHHGRRFTPSHDELQALTDFTDVAALVLGNAILADDSRSLVKVLERSRIATELHDGVTQMLFAVDLALQEALAVPRLPVRARQHVERARRDVGLSSKQLRAALFELTQEPDDTAGARDASGRQETPTDEGPWLKDVRAAVDAFFQRSGIGVDLQVRGEGRAPSTDALNILLRTVREGTANVMKHAEATEVLVVIRRSDHWWMVEVHDDGIGDATALRRALTLPDPAERGHTGFGLYSLKSQAARVGGRLWLSASSRLHGLQVTTSVPAGADG